MVEELNFAYTDVYAGKAQTGEINAQVSLNEVYSKLSTEMKSHIYTVDGTSTISLVNSNQSSITLLNDAEAIGSTGTAGQNTVTVEINEERESTSYYLESDGIYYPMCIRNSKVELDEESASTIQPTSTKQQTGSLGSGLTIKFIDNGTLEETDTSNYVEKSLSGTKLTLTAKANVNGSTQVVVRDGDVTLTGNIEVTVNPTYEIILGTMPNGGVVITTNNVDTTLNTKYGSGVKLLLTATGEEKYKFNKWIDNNSTTNPREIIVDENTTSEIYKALFNFNIYGTPVQLNGGNQITIKGSNKIADNWRLFYIDDNSYGYVHLIYGDYYPANVQTEITSGNTIFVPAHKDNNNNASSNSDYAWSVNSRTNRLTLLKYLKNNSGYSAEETSLDTSTPTGSYASWTNLATALTGTGKALNGKNILVQGAPNITMWVKSWKEQGYTELVLSNNSYGYLINGSSVHLSDEPGYNDALYFPYKNTESENGNADRASGYWLASPGGFYTNYMCVAFSNGNVLSANDCFIKSACARPVVSILKSDFKNLFPNINIEK